VNQYLDGGAACFIAYSKPANALFLVNDTGTGLSPPLTLGGTGSVNNSQCTINAQGSSAAPNGNTLVLTLNITWGNGFTGPRIFYLAARDATDANNSGWQSMGAWIVQ
jgi:hypothetical protein